MELNSLYKFFARRTSDAEVSQIRAWAESSAENMDTLLGQRQIFDAMLLLSDDYNAKKSIRTKNRSRYIGYAAIMIGVALISIFATLYLQSSPNAEMLTLKVPPGQQLELNLSDGTIVYINGGSSFSYPSFFDKSQRVVEIEGQCFFEVSKIKDCPFLINTSLGSVQVLGTTLNVDVNSKEEYFNTALIEGRANVESKGQTYALSPGQMVTITSSDVAVISAIPQGDEYLWTKGIISFHELSLPSIMKRFEKYFGITIQIKNPEKFTQSYTGKFHINDGVEYALKVLQYDTTFNYDWDHASKTITIY